MAWNAGFEATPDGATEAGSTLDNYIKAFKVMVRKFLAIIVTDTSGNAVGAGADEDNPQIKDECIDSDAYVDGSIDNAHLSAECVGATKLGDAASYNNARTRYYAVSLTGSLGGSTAFGYGDKVYWSDSSTFKGAVNLPHGATITELYTYASTVDDNNIVVTLYRCPYNNQTEEAMATTTHVAAGAQTDDTIANATIDNSAYKYYVDAARAAHTNAAYLSMIRIKYTITVPLP